MLFKAISELRKYIALDANTKFTTLTPYIADAEELFIKPLLGNFYSEFVIDYTDNTDASGADMGMGSDNLLLLTYVQRALSNYAMYTSVDQLGVAIGEMGIQQNYGQQSQPAPRWRIRDLKKNLVENADRFADKLLEYLEENATVSKFTSWYSDISANTKMSGTIVYNTRIASQYIDINHSRRVFLRLKKRIRDIESSAVQRFICGSQYDEIVQQLQEGMVTSANSKLIRKLEAYISKRALYETLPSLRISVNHEGIHLLSVSDSTITAQSAGEVEIKALKHSLKEGDIGFLNDEKEIQSFIIQNISDYPLIQSSPCYSPTPTQRKYVADNDPCNKHFSV